MSSLAWPTLQWSPKGNQRWEPHSPRAGSAPQLLLLGGALLWCQGSTNNHQPSAFEGSMERPSSAVYPESVVFMQQVSGNKRQRHLKDESSLSQLQEGTRLYGLVHFSLAKGPFIIIRFTPVESQSLEQNLISKFPPSKGQCQMQIPRKGIPQCSGLF